MKENIYNKLRQLGGYQISTSKLVSYLVFILLAVVALYYLNSGISESHIFNRQSIEAFIKQAGVFSWLVYILIIAVSVMGPFPSSPLVLVGGFIFNPFLVIVFTIIGEAIGATGNFFIGRKFGKRIILKHIPRVGLLIEKYKEHFNRETIFLLSLVPVGTANITGYAAGILGLKYKHYIISCVSGISLLNIFVVLLGYSAQVHSLSLTISIIVLGVSVAFLVKKVLRSLE